MKKIYRNNVRKLMDLSPIRSSNWNLSFTRSTNAPNINNSNVQENIDEAEAQSRRENVQIHPSFTNINQEHVQVVYNESYIKEYFILCTHLHMENKINVKNVWKLKIIDILKDLCSNPDRNVFAVAGTSLDICAKVYSMRVDDIHSQALKLASNMNSVSNNLLALTEDDGALSDYQDTAGAAYKTKKKKKPRLPVIKTTVYQDAKHITGNLQKRDPTDFSTRVNVQSSIIDNLFTNVLKEDRVGCTFALLDNTCKLFGETDQTVQEARDIDLGTDFLPIFPENELAVNLPFNNFLLNNWDLDKEEQQILNKHSKIDDAVVYDEDGFSIPELDGPGHDTFENDDHPPDSADGEDNVQSVSAQSCGAIPKIVDLRPNNQITVLSEYSYIPIIRLPNGKFIDRIWAGPNHWMLKCIRSAAIRFTGQEKVIETYKKKRRKHNTSQKIHFSVVPDIYVEIEPKVVVRRNRSECDINKLVSENSSVREIFDDIGMPKLKPLMRIVQKKPREQVDYEVSTNRYENGSDSLYCPRENMDDGDDREGDVVSEVQTHVRQENIAKENLAAPPQMVPNFHLQYASKSEQINMKELKAAEWQYLTRSESVTTEEESLKVVPTLFSEMYQEIPPLLSERDRNALSCPLAFFSLLQLASENNLDLEQLPGDNDLKIKGPMD